MTSKRHAFTLMELLVVIAIIGILAGLLFPAVNGALDSARKAQAKNDVVQIATAVTAFETEYGRFPVTNASSFVDTALVKILTAQDDAANPRKIAFIEVGERKPVGAEAGKAGKSGTNSSGFVDPWGGRYRVALDSDYNNEVSAGTNSVSLRKRVAVWNEPEGKDANQKGRRYVTSWE